MPFPLYLGAESSRAQKACQGGWLKGIEWSWACHDLFSEKDSRYFGCRWFLKQYLDITIQLSYSNNLYKSINKVIHKLEYPSKGVSPCTMLAISSCFRQWRRSVWALLSAEFWCSPGINSNPIWIDWWIEYARLKRSMPFEILMLSEWTLANKTLE